MDVTLKEIDARHGLPKGSAFRAFKALAGLLVEGEHFRTCDSRVDAAAFAELMASGRLYPATVNAVLVTAAGQALIASRLNAAARG